MIGFWAAMSFGLLCFGSFVLFTVWVMDACQARWGDSFKAVAIGAAAMWFVGSALFGAGIIGITVIAEASK